MASVTSSEQTSSLTSSSTEDDLSPDQDIATFDPNNNDDESQGSDDFEFLRALEREETPPPTQRLVHNAREENVHLNIDSLMSMTPLFQDRDVARIASRHLFLAKLKSQKAVSVFFPTHRADVYESVVQDSWFDFETYAVLYVCQALAKCCDPYDIHTLVDEDKVDKHMQEISECPEWKKVGFAIYTSLFPDLVKDVETCTSFRAYLNSDRKVWAHAMLEKISDSKWQYNVLHPVVRGQCTSTQYNRDMNILFIKLHLLDPTLVMPAYHMLRKALPELNLELATTNYLGDPLDWSLIKKEAEAVVYKPMYPSNVSRLNLGEVEVYYGVEALEFIMVEPRELELLTENIPDNHRTTTLRDRCVVM